MSDTTLLIVVAILENKQTITGHKKPLPDYKKASQRVLEYAKTKVTTVIIILFYFF